ncbi:MAG: LytR C-terminal domain-containing protein [Chitinispirillaceae bacterium]|nr:LytR C-terminal domain-containing protein [Chitinispirillaceae bacterium]
MHTRNIIPLAAVSTFLLIAMTIGVSRTTFTLPDLLAGARAGTEVPIPHIGSIQVLNGCGVTGAGDKIADFLRLKKFDVKNIGNAGSWNYPFTLVISRTTDMTVARQIAGTLTTDRCILLRTGDTTYNVTVIIGPDYEERIR